MPSPLDILIRMPNWLGDAVMALPAVRHLHETLPEARIILAGRQQYRSLLSALPGVHAFVEAPASGATRLLSSLRKGKRALRDAGLERTPELGLLFTNSLSTAAWLWRVGTKKRIGYDLDCRKLFLTDPVPCGGMELSLHFVHYYLWLARVAEHLIRESGETPSRHIDTTDGMYLPRLFVSSKAEEKAAALLADAGVQGNYAVLAPASAYGPVKDWPETHYSALAKRLEEDFGIAIVVTGAAAQRDACERVAAGLKNGVNIAGRTGLDDFAGVLAGASLFVGGDSGGAHVAASLGIPTIVIFGITNPSRTKPTGRKVALVGHGEDTDINLDSSSSREAAKLALASIHPETVLEEARELLE